MKNLKIDEYCKLTTSHPASHYGIPVLVYYKSGRAFGPSESIVAEKFSAIWSGKSATASYMICNWATHHDLTVGECKFVKSFLGQWPDGPQLVDDRIQIHLTEDAYPEGGSTRCRLAELHDWYQASAEDAEGNLYRVFWEIIDADCEGGSDACDWDNPWAVKDDCGRDVTNKVEIVR